MPKKAISLKQDLHELLRLKPESIKNLEHLLQEAEPTEAHIGRTFSPSFHRMLASYAQVKESLSEQEIREARKHVEVGPLLEWFDTKLPNIESQPGYAQLVEWAKKKMGQEGIESTVAVDRGYDAESKSIATINAFRAQRYLAGARLRPHLRVFLKNGDDVLLDSSGDWNDWLFVVKCLLQKLEEQAESIEDLPKAWEDVPWPKVQKHLKDGKKALRAFEKRLKTKMPQPARTATTRKKK